MVSGDSWGSLAPVSCPEGPSTQSVRGSLASVLKSVWDTPTPESLIVGNKLYNLVPPDMENNGLAASFQRCSQSSNEKPEPEEVDPHPLCIVKSYLQRLSSL